MHRVGVSEHLTHGESPSQLFGCDVRCTYVRVQSTGLEVVDPVLQDDIIKVD